MTGVDQPAVRQPKLRRGTLLLWAVVGVLGLALVAGAVWVVPQVLNGSQREVVGVEGAGDPPRTEAIDAAPAPGDTKTVDGTVYEWVEQETQGVRIGYFKNQHDLEQERVGAQPVDTSGIFLTVQESTGGTVEERLAEGLPDNAADCVVERTVVPGAQNAMVTKCSTAYGIGGGPFHAVNAELANGTGEALMLFFEIGAWPGTSKTYQDVERSYAALELRVLN